MITHEKRDNIRAAAEKATKGPWACYYSGLADVTCICGTHNEGVLLTIPDQDNPTGKEQPDFHFIALTDPDTILDLLTALDKAEKENESKQLTLDIFGNERDMHKAENTRLRKALIQHRGDLHCGSGRPCGTCKQSAEALGIDVPDRCAQGHIDNKALTPKKN